MKSVNIYTDGSCKSNPGPGGWAAVLVYGKTEKEISGGAADTTNNRMELTAVIKGLQALKYPCHVTLTSDSKYVLDAIRLGWAERWKKNNWMRNKKEKALNPDLWEALLLELDRHEMEYVWVKGHAGHPQNERCDEMAVAESKKFI